jgi:dUTP pyrophosphatase
MTYTLNLFIDNDNGNLYSKYLNVVKIRQTEKYISNPCKDSGFDIYIPNDLMFKPNETTLVDLGIKAVMYDDRCYKNISSAYYLYARSSIYKTPFRLANNVGIIDSGYRGNLKGAFSNMSNNNQIMKENTRLLQICSPDLSPFVVKINDEFESTIRGDKGFGSSGF